MQSAGVAAPFRDGMQHLHIHDVLRLVAVGLDTRWILERGHAGEPKEEEGVAEEKPTMK